TTRSDLTRGEKRIYSAPAGEQIDAPQWSPDGNRIVFVQRAGASSRILLLELASARVSEVASDGAAPSWAPDGSRIAFARGAGLFTGLADGSGEQALPIDGAGVRELAWSPDGELLALWVENRIDLAAVDGSTRETAVGDAVGEPAWAPDSQSFVYTRD